MLRKIVCTDDAYHLTLFMIVFSLTLLCVLGSYFSFYFGIPLSMNTGRILAGQR